MAAAAVIIIDGSKKLVEACQEYNEAKRIENEAKGLDIFGNHSKLKVTIVYPQMKTIAIEKMIETAGIESIRRWKE